MATKGDEPAKEESPSWLEVMVRRRKSDLALAAQAGREVPVAELAILDKLETRLSVRERVRRVQEATRTRGESG